MAVVKGDRIGESRKLNSRSVDAQDWYAAFLAAVPDSFGRFRLSATHIHVRMYPRRELTRALVLRVQRRLDELGSGDEPLWLAWEIDGVSFAELTGATSGHRHYHETPEPPWSTHVCSRFCGKSALFQAVQWGCSDFANALRLRLKNLRVREPVEGVSSGATVNPLHRIVQIEQQTTDSPADAGAPEPVLVPEPAAELRTAAKLVKRRKPEAGNGRAVQAMLVPEIRLDDWPADWVAQLLGVWSQHGHVAPGRLGAALRPLRGGLWSFVDVQVGLGRYLDAGKAQFGPEPFAASVGEWISGRAILGGGGALARAQQIAEANADSIAAVVNFGREER
jgi:hypothetical protein